MTMVVAGAAFLSSRASLLSGTGCVETGKYPDLGPGMAAWSLLDPALKMIT